MAYICNFHKQFILDFCHPCNLKLINLVRNFNNIGKPLRIKESMQVKISTLHTTSSQTSCNVNNLGILKSKNNVGIIKTNTQSFSTSKIRNIFGQKDDNAPPESRIMLRTELFQARSIKEKKGFLEVLNIFKDENTIRRGHVEFIYTCMRYMEEFGVERDLETYKSIMEIFPKGKMIAENRIQVEFYHFPKHQTCALDLLDKMEGNGICPDVEMSDIIKNTFGGQSHVYRKYARMMYWMPKFKNLSPFPLPNPVPNDALELARMAINRMCVDLQSYVNEYDAKELEDSVDKTWIVSGMSPKQRQLIKEHDASKAVYVEGPYQIWLRRKSISYYRLRAEPKIYPEIDEDQDDVRNLDSSILNPIKTKATILKPTVHEQDDGIFLALCATGTSSRDSLLSWIRFLQKENPKLLDIPVLFTLKAPSKELVTVNLTSDQDLLSDNATVPIGRIDNKTVDVEVENKVNKESNEKVQSASK